MTLCFCTGSYAAGGTRHFSRDNFRTTLTDFTFSRIGGPKPTITWLDFGRFLSWRWPWMPMSICYISVKNCLIAIKTKSKHINWTLCLKCDHRVLLWPWTWPWIFKGKYLIRYIYEKWSDCHETKNGCNDWTLGLKCSHKFILWPWPWHWIFKFQLFNRCISGMAEPIGAKWKGDKLTGWWANKVTVTFYHTHGLDNGFWRPDFEIVVSQEWEGRLTWNKGGVGGSFLTMTVTIWWPSSGVRIYRIVTVVTSDGIPSTRQDIVWLAWC